MATIEELLNGPPTRDGFGNPKKGAVQSIVMHNTHGGWICTIQYWFVARWNEAHGPEPAECLRKALAMEPNYQPLPESVPASLRKAVAERCGETIDDAADLLVKPAPEPDEGGDLEDLLV